MPTIKNRLELRGVDQYINLTFGMTNIIGTSAEETIKLSSNVQDVNVNIGTGSKIFLNENYDQYSITRPGGNTVRVEDNFGDLVALIDVGGTGKIGFANGMTDLDINPGTGSPRIGQLTLGSSPIDLSSITFEDLPSTMTDVTINTATLVGYSTSDVSPFVATSTENNYIFEIDASQSNTFYIHGFTSKDKIRFINSITGSLGDLNVSNTDYSDGEVSLTVRSVDVHLSGLICAAIWDAVSFRNMLGVDSIEILGE